jgi:agmatinase
MWNKDFWLPHNFAALPKAHSDYNCAKAAIIPVPYEHTTSHRTGTRFGPSAIIAASQNLELYDEELKYEPYRVGICTLDGLEPVLGNQGQMTKRIARVTKSLLKDTKLPVALGGEHSLSVGLVEALVCRYPGLSVLQLDAHADLRDSYQGSKYNHACTMRRISELAPFVQVGIRSLSRGEADWAKDQGLKIFWAKEIMHNHNWQAEVVESLSPEVYITIDLDVFDPGIMPAVGTPEPGGLDWYPVLQLLKLVAEKKRVVGFDVVELCPLPGNVAPDFMAAKLVYKLLGYIFNREHPGQPG